MTVERELFPFGENVDEDLDVKGWVVPVQTLIHAIAKLGDLDEGVWMAVRDRETGEYIDPERFALFVHHGDKSDTLQVRRQYCYYGGVPDPTNDPDNGWFDDFPPIPPGT